MIELPIFRYFVSLTTSSVRQSTFQLFDGAWLMALDFIAQIVQCPCTIDDLDKECHQRAELRVLGRARHWIAVVPTTTIDQIHSPPPFTVLFTSADTDNWGRGYVAARNEPVLHVPETALNGETSRSQLSRETFVQFSNAVLEHMAVLGATDIRTIGPVPHIEDRASVFTHILAPPYIRTAPNHAALGSVGHPNIEYRSVTKPEDKTDDAARRAFEAVVEFRRQVLASDLYPPGLTNILLSSAGFSRRWRHVSKVRSDDSDFERVAHAFASIRRFRGLDLIPPDLVYKFEQHSMATDVLKEREFEIRGQAVAAMVESCSQVLPTVLLPNGLGRPIRDRKAIADLLRHRGRIWSPGDIAIVRRLGDGLSSSIPKYATDYIRSNYGTLKAFMDEPIEMMTLEGRPLSMQRPVVRAPVTPGLLLTRQVAICSPLVLTRSDFQRVLVLRGTRPTDAVYPWLERFCEGMAAAQRTRVSIDTIDVRTESDVRQALENFNGAMMAFDAHGIHLAGQVGYLEIGNDLVSLHGLRANWPPIVFLASCETQAIGRAEETVSAALLNAGVRCVIGTMTSVSAGAAGLLFSDLVARATHSQPMYGGLLRWSDFFAASLWACHAIEAAMVLAEADVIKLSAKEIGQFADRLEQHLVRFHRPWFDAACRELSEMCGVSAEVIQKEWVSRAYVTDCSMFCQLGQPDTILLEPIDQKGDDASTT